LYLKKLNFEVKIVEIKRLLYFVISSFYILNIFNP